ncbi:capsule assembly Wzi family protein [Penaeicola halotolerans]|uniref:capsule assembly Wzi family protein n=1 Tax=Penaeicola halotolerans TaxID=2793196 RepID=UPI001CF901D0|nr:capsule assembly Wzi family protein [Penaeicola halotolerans]
MSFVILGMSISTAFAQVKDSLAVEVLASSIFSTNRDLLPHYLFHQQLGELSDGDEAYYRALLSYERTLSKDFKVGAGFRFASERFTSHYLYANWRAWQLQAGRIIEDQPFSAGDLGMGAFGISQNARPLPQVGLVVKDKPVPFTQGRLTFNASWSHRWFDDDRYVERPYMHEKSLLLTYHVPRWRAKFSGGMQHFAQWGGTLPSGRALPQTFTDYLRVTMGRESVADFVDGSDPVFAEVVNALGNHLGTWNLSYEQAIGNDQLALYYQKPWEDRSGILPFRSGDLQLGLSWKRDKPEAFIQEIFIEYLNTTYQSGPGTPDSVPGQSNRGYRNGGRDDYYNNNFVYRSGWTYEGMVIGNPMMTTYDRALKYLPYFYNQENAIANNRVWAMHMGFKGKITPDLSHRVLFTASRNQGTYTGLYQGRYSWGGVAEDPTFAYPYKNGLWQFYTLVALEQKNVFAVENLNLGMNMMFDFGEMYAVQGVQVFVKYQLSHLRRGL